MEVRWNSEALGEVFVLPAAVVDRHIRLAGSAQLKVLLWLSRAGGGVFDPESCGKAIGCPLRTVPTRCNIGWKPGSWSCPVPPLFRRLQSLPVR